MKKIALALGILGLVACQKPTHIPLYDTAVAHVKEATMDDECKSQITTNSVGFFKSWQSCDPGSPGWTVTDESEFTQFQKWIDTAKLEPAIKLAYQNEFDEIKDVSDRTKKYGCPPPEEDETEHPCGEKIPQPEHVN